MSLGNFNLDLIRQYKSESYNQEFEHSMMETLFERKDYAMVVECLKNGFEMNQNVFRHLIESYDLICYQYLYPVRWTFTSKILSRIIRYGELDLIQWGCSLKNPTFVDILTAIQRTRVDIFLYLLGRCQTSRISDFYRESIKFNAICILEWLIVNHPPDFNDIKYCTYTLYSGSNKTFKWLVEKGFRYDKRFMLTFMEIRPEFRDYIDSLPSD